MPGVTYHPFAEPPFPMLVPSLTSRLIVWRAKDTPASPTLDRDNLPFGGSLPEFKKLFPDDAAWATYLEAIRWCAGFACQWCGQPGEPYRFANRPHVLRCR
jgi:hypothetical protein